MALYFSYGSNMSLKQMARRCPGARPVCGAVLKGWRFHITTAGGASIEPLREGLVMGGLWRCEPRHIRMLDGYEGVAVGSYRRRYVRVRTTAGRSVRALTYISNRRWSVWGPTNYMLTAVLVGALDFQLPEDYIAELSDWLHPRPIGERRLLYRGRRR